MSAFKQKLARLGATAGVLAASTAAFMAVGGASASIASAACVSPTTEGTTIAGSGSSLQKVAQENWTPALHTLCSTQTVTYTSTSSGKGLTAFGFQPGSTINHEFAFIGSDDGPNPTQIAHAEEQSSTKPLIIPVAETAIAVVINPPGAEAECKLTTGENHGIGWVALTKIFGGKEIKTWAKMKEEGIVTGEGCTGNITRVVRAEGSGTTYQFKNYLGALQEEHSGAAMPCSLEGVKENAKGEEVEKLSTTAWKNMRRVGAKTGTEEPPNTTWPEPSNCSETSTVVRKEGGGEVAKYVHENNGTIGYAALPDAHAKEAEVAQLQDVSTPKYAGPIKSSTTESNCGKRTYTVPGEGKSGEAENWSQVFGASPAAGSLLYPLCTLTYDVAWRNYTTAGYTSGAKIGKNVKSYDQYLLAGGQSVLSEHYYQPLPSLPLEPTHDVLGIAETSVGHIE